MRMVEIAWMGPCWDMNLLLSLVKRGQRTRFVPLGQRGHRRWCQSMRIARPWTALGVTGMVTGADTGMVTGADTGMDMEMGTPMGTGIVMDVTMGMPTRHLSISRSHALSHQALYVRP